MSFDTSRRVREALPELTDPKALRALAHPKRIALLSLLTVEQQLTASEAGRLLDESPASCSFHLQQLARHGFVEEAGPGRGRRRPWRRTSSGFRWGESGAEPEAAAAATELSRVVQEQHAGEMLSWIDRADAEPAEWRDAAVSVDNTVYLTAAELEELRGTMLEIAYLQLERRYGDRAGDPSRRPPGARPVRVFGIAFPLGRPVIDDGAS
jgi:predicted ArsR family transcriptional regulator